MKNRQFLLLLLGVVSILAQTVLLREMLVEVSGNEIVFSLYLSLWLFFVAAGSFLARFVKNPVKSVKTAFTILLLSIPLQFYFIRDLAAAFTFVSGQMLDLSSVFLLGLIVLLPGCLLLGFLFPQLCELLKNSSQPVHRAYLLECCGIILGSVVFAASVFWLPQSSLLCLLSAGGFLLLYLVFGKKWFLLPFLLFLLVSFFSDSFYRMNYSRRYYAQNLISTQDSPFGRLDVTEKSGQKNYYWNGDLFASEDNEMYAQQMVHFVMLQHPAASEILLAGGLLNGFLPEILHYDSVRNIDYIEMDQNILQQAPASDKVNFIRSDPVRHIQKTANKYDLIFFDLPDPSSLFLNRFYTQEFFHSLKSVLQDSLSVAAITISSGTNFMTRQIISLNATIFHSFSAEFPDPVIIPASKNIFLGSAGGYITNSVEILQRRNRLEKNWFNDTVIWERCNPLRIRQLQEAILAAPVRFNTFSDPKAYLSTLSLWLNLSGFDPFPAVVFLQTRWLLVVLFALLPVLGIALIVSAFTRSGEYLTDLNIFSISLINFGLQLVLINLFQMKFGFVYLVIFLFTASFMLGLIAGFSGFRYLDKISITAIWLINLLLVILLIMIFDLNLPVVLYFLFNLLFAFLEGTGLAKLLAKKKAGTNRGSSFYFLDSLGAMSGGIVASLFVIPLVGLKHNLIFLGGILLINLTISSISLPFRK